MNMSQFQFIIDSIIEYLKKENLHVESLIVKERRSRIEAYLKLSNNPLGISTIKLIFSKNTNKFRVFSTRTSIDLRLKKLIARELAKSGGKR